MLADLMEVWLHSFCFPGAVVPLARQAEGWGFDGLLLGDSQNLNADVWMELALAGAATERLALGPGVTNLSTRHLTVTASAAATLHAETGGRAVLGLGRGDTAVSELGKPPASLEELGRSLEALRLLLRGVEVEIDGAPCALKWWPVDHLDPVRVEVAASGPSTITVAARHGDGVNLALGADPARLRAGAETARRAAGAEVSLGAFLNVAVHPDPAVARHLVRGTAAILAGFSRGWSASRTADLGLAGTTAGGAASDDSFLDRFAVIGAPEEVTERLLEVEALGFERLIVLAGSPASDPVALGQATHLFAEEVLPHLRRGAED